MLALFWKHCIFFNTRAEHLCSSERVKEEKKKGSMHHNLQATQKTHVSVLKKLQCIERVSMDKLVKARQKQTSLLLVFLELCLFSGLKKKGNQ